MSNISPIDAATQLNYASLQLPKINELLLQTKRRDLSFLYSNKAESTTLQTDFGQQLIKKEDEQKTKLGSKKREVTKNTGSKIKKSEIYEKYYIDDVKAKKFVPLKKIVFRFKTL